ncbi:alpha-2 adrenergic receptor [Trichonephila clavipes]|nr:alpha-2 adrenergic receptor [Trichonephila clavipes]
MIPPAHKAHQTVSFSGCNGVSTYTCGLASHQMRQFFFLDVAIQPEVRFIAKQNSLMKIGNNGNLVLGPFDKSTPCLMIVLMNCQTKLRINHLTAVKSVAILESFVRENKFVSSGFHHMWVCLGTKLLMSWPVGDVISLTPVPLSYPIRKSIP